MSIYIPAHSSIKGVLTIYSQIVFCAWLHCYLAISTDTLQWNCNIIFRLLDYLIYNEDSTVHHWIFGFQFSLFCRNKNGQLWRCFIECLDVFPRIKSWCRTVLIHTASKHQSEIHQQTCFLLSFPKMLILLLVAASVMSKSRTLFLF